MNWFTKIFETKSILPKCNVSADAIYFFAEGKKIWNNAVISKVPHEQQLIKIKEALIFFDKAIEKGFTSSEIYSLRGSSLNDLGFYFDALKDYDMAIEQDIDKVFANNYFMRSLIKETIFDFEGSLADINEAIRLSKFDTENNKYWNDYSIKSIGMSAVTFYEFHLSDLNRRLQREKISPCDKSELNKIQRRS